MSRHSTDRPGREVTGPLDGVRVVEPAGIGPGPFAAMVLADLGANVVRVDRPGASPLGGDPAHDVTNRNKRSVVIDLKSSEGPRAVQALAARADILVEGDRPGVAERLGVGPEECLAVILALVYGRMYGWGRRGPLASLAGHDIGCIATAGALSMIGTPDGQPVPPVNLLGDYAGGSLHLTTGVLAALLTARATGRGQVVDAAIVDGTAHLTTMFWGMLAEGIWRDARGRTLLDGGCPYYGVHETADAGWMAVGALEPQFHAVFVSLLGLDTEDLPDRADPHNRPALRAEFTARFKMATRTEWTAALEGTDACVAPVLSLHEAAGHRRLAGRGTCTEAYGSTQPAPAPRFSATPGTLRLPPAVPGAHTPDVARDRDVPELLKDHR
ncbi:CaiB/BaiF CoA transferase family protein [Streptomyces sp. NPDC002776]